MVASLHSSLRTKVTLWFIVIVLAVGSAGYLGYYRISHLVREEADTRMTDKLGHVVDMLDSPYITGYEPIHDAAGEIIGVYYVGYPLEQLTLIREALAKSGILDSGFFALLDSSNKVIFHTSGTRFDSQISAVTTAHE